MSTVHQLHLGHVRLPESHPRSVEGTCEIFSYLIDHPDGLTVVDTGPRAGHPVIDKLYRPTVISIVEAINLAGFDERNVVSVINTHLHFDHCGQNYLLASAPVWVTQAELEAATADHYTVPEWSHIDPGRVRLSAENEEIAVGIRVLHTPGHTPGHQLVALETQNGLELIVGQVCHNCAEYSSSTLLPSEMHDETWTEAGRMSIRYLWSFNPTRVHFSHDSATFQPGHKDHKSHGT